jgi:hypothetical protein
MAKSKFFRLWGSDAAADAPEGETEEQKAKRLAAEEKERRLAAEEEAKKKAENGDDEDDDDEEDGDEDEEGSDDDRKAVRARNLLRAAGDRRGVRAERARIHAIVNGAGPERVASALHVAFNTRMSAAAAIEMVKGLPADKAQAGKLGLAPAMNARGTTVIGPDGGAGGGKAGDEATTLAASVLNFASRKPKATGS